MRVRASRLRDGSRLIAMSAAATAEWLCIQQCFCGIERSITADPKLSAAELSAFVVGVFVEVVAYVSELLGECQYRPKC